MSELNSSDTTDTTENPQAFSEILNTSIEGEIEGGDDWTFRFDRCETIVRFLGIDYVSSIFVLRGLREDDWNRRTAFN